MPLLDADLVTMPLLDVNLAKMPLLDVDLAKMPLLDVDLAKMPLLDASILTAKTVSVDEILIERIADIIASYRISGPNDRYEEGMKPKMLETLRSFLANQEPINMVVPAYPFKSPNRESKVLGPNPDVGERMTLQHLNSIGARIQQVYPPGGHVTIISDGPCYNDLLGVSDEEVFDYARGLHRIAGSLGLTHLKFTDIFELADNESSPTTTDEFASRVGELKKHLFWSFLPPGYNFDEDIKTDPNALLTYRGYIKFLESDLAIFFREKGLSKCAAKKQSSKVARGMIERGKAFSAFLASKSPLHVRLSIHASDNFSKLSVALLPHKRYSSFPVTPWHNTPYLDVNNASLSLGRRPTDSSGIAYKICTDELGLHFLCADVPMYSRLIGAHGVTALNDQLVKLEPLYPVGLKIQVPSDSLITDIILENVVDLAKLHSLVIFEKMIDPTRYSFVKQQYRRQIPLLSGQSWFIVEHHPPECMDYHQHNWQKDCCMVSLCTTPHHEMSLQPVKDEQHIADTDRNAWRSSSL